MFRRSHAKFIQRDVSDVDRNIIGWSLNSEHIDSDYGHYSVLVVLYEFRIQVPPKSLWAIPTSNRPRRYHVPAPPPCCHRDEIFGCPCQRRPEMASYSRFVRTFGSQEMQMTYLKRSESGAIM